ncbi:hypothetical protein [Metabacillus fastidiosus]|uniref:hypothetical protein n=1 Tax=Metabacillus fastidiosus TaxID=1458 RepID=UPI003D2B5D18
MRHDAPFSKKELETGFYEAFQKKILPYEKIIGGMLVDHKIAKDAYNIGLLDEKVIK